MADGFETGSIAVRVIQSSADLARYEAWILSHPQGTLWQSLEWHAYQSALGRQVRIYADIEGDDIVASAMMIIDKTTFGLSVWDCPRGPLWKYEVQKSKTEIMDRIIADAKTDRCMSIYLSPAKLTTYHPPLTPSLRHEQPQATIVIDLQQPQEEILKQMHAKGRYNIRLAQKHGVEIKESIDVDAFYTLVSKTGGRDGFRVLKKSHYSRFLEHIEGSFFLMACHAKKPIAGLLGVKWNDMGIYYYGASDHSRRHLMAPYLLQWEAMRRCKAHGCKTYDLLGIDPPGTARDTGWAGITDFKRKFGGKVTEYPAEQQIVLRPIVQTLLAAKRRIW